MSQDGFSDSDENGQNEESIININGLVLDASSGGPLAGSNITIEESETGAATDEDGAFSLEDVRVGSAITATMIGYESQTLYADSEKLEFSLEPSVIEMSALEVLASRAGEKTPVSYTNISKEDLELRLGSRDIPMALNTVPSIYATNQGGGAGDARINVRGFNQRNVAIMLNGIPVNDMENGWVYWSNWDGLADATSSIQMQKGLSAQNLATPSIGGSMNIITDPSSQTRRGLFKQELGAWGFYKTTASFHTGLIMDDKLAMSGTIVRKAGEGYYKGTWTDAWAYYFDASYNLNDNHRLQFYALGAPQQHGQNRYRQNIAAYDTEYAKSLEDYDPNALGENGGEFVELGRDFNQNTAEISSASQAILDAAGGQYWQMYGVYDGVERHEKDRLNERMNFFHKPQVALNHYWTINDDMRLTTSTYWSGGMGGGSGHYGDVARIDADGISDLRAEKHKFYYGPSPWVWDYDGTIAANASNASNTVIFQGDTVSRGNQESIGILRNSNNRQSTLGLLSKLNYKLNSNLNVEAGLDWRTAKIYHVKEIRDLLGGQYFVNTDSDFDTDGQQKTLGDPIDYNFTNTVNWLGLFGQAAYEAGDLSAYGMVGLTSVKYTMWDHFKKASEYNYSYVESKDGSSADWVNGGGNAGELYIEADPIATSQLKGGLMYNLGDIMSFASSIPVIGKLYDNTDLWFNFGLIDKAPTFDQVIQDWDAKLATDPQNEKFTAFEFGFNFASNDGSLASKINFYTTQWSDRIQTKSVQDQGDSSDDIIVYLTGIDQAHSGFEVELAAQVHPLLRVDLGLGYGNWIYTDDAQGTYRSSDSELNYGYALKDLKVGDMPQTNLSIGLTSTPVEGLVVSTNYRYYDRHFADWNVSSREFDPTTTDASSLPNQTWMAPSYGVLDLHLYYDMPFEFGAAKPQLFVHVFNALDEVYIQDATHNSAYNSWNQTGSSDDAEVFFGMPTSFNVGLSVNF
jgi:outer membrane cobalamin receptor